MKPLIIRIGLFAFSILVLQNLSAQSFTFHSESPFNIQLSALNETQITVKLIFADRDNDGDKDLFLFGFGLDETGIFNFDHLEYFIEYQENIGTKYEPMFGTREIAFNEFEFPRGPFLPSIGDFNGDGRIDLIAHAEIEYAYEIQSMVFYVNKNIESEDVFDKIDGTEYGVPQMMPRSFMWPELVDLDSDGDLDILSSGNIPTDLSFTSLRSLSQYAKNIGTKESPEYIGWFENPYNIKNDTLEEIMKAGDIDNDGDVDILSIVSNEGFTPIYFRENVPLPNGKPFFIDPVESPFGLPESTEEISFFDPILVDIDGDNDLDIFMLIIDEAYQESVLRYYINDFCATTFTEISTEICEGESVEGYSISGEYTDTFTASNGCDSVRILHVIVNPISENQISDDLCEGDIYYIDSQEITTSGTYNFVLESSNGCDSIIEADLIFHSIDPEVMLNGNTLSATSSGLTYQWIDCLTNMDILNAIDQSYIVENSGDYAVRITDAYGCEQISNCISVTISNTKETEISDKIHFYPNPTSGKMYINNMTNYKIDKMRLIDQAGKQLSSFNHGLKEMNFDNLPPAIYFLEVIIGDNSFVKKIVIF